MSRQPDFVRPKSHDRAQHLNAESRWTRLSHEVSVHLPLFSTERRRGDGRPDRPGAIEGVQEGSAYSRNGRSCGLTGRALRLWRAVSLAVHAMLDGAGFVEVFIADRGIWHRRRLLRHHRGGLRSGGFVRISSTSKGFSTSSS